MLHPSLPSLPARIVGVIYSPRATLEAVVRAPRWAGVLALTYVVTTASMAILFETQVGRLALLDQWERTAAAFGQAVNDSQYAAMEDASEHGAAYAAVNSLASGPMLAAGLSAVLFAAFGAARGGAATYRQVLAVVAHAGVILALRQIIAAPVTYARETLASPMTMSLFFTMLDEASPVARFFGIIDFFVMWWIAVLAVGMSMLYRRPARRLALMFVGAYVALAAILAGVMAVTGGTA